MRSNHLRMTGMVDYLERNCQYLAVVNRKLSLGGATGAGSILKDKIEKQWKIPVRHVGSIHRLSQNQQNNPVQRILSFSGRHA
ncbi:MAG: hypothetical protein ACLTG5_02665 [Dorea sp.]